MFIRMLAAASVVLLCVAGCEFEPSHHHQPGHTGGPPTQDPGNGNNGENEFCQSNDDCDPDEGCTQGGQCIDITGTTSVLQELQAEIDALPDAVGLGVPYELPANAVLRIDDDNGDGLGLQIDNAIILEGNGVRMLVENDMVGIRLTNGASWSRIENLRIDPHDPRTEHTGIGIDVRSHGVRLKNILVRRMGTGIRAHTRANDLPHANVNTQQWSRIILRNNYHHGMHVRSQDSNAGLFSGIEVLGGGGIQDDSFLGNTYIAPVIQSQTSSSFARTGRAGASTVLGMYLEDSAADPVTNSQNDLHVGGNAIRRLETVGDRVGGLATTLRFRNDAGVQMRIPGGPHEPFAFRHPSENGNEWRMKYFNHNQKWGFSYQGLGAKGDMPYRWTGIHHPEGHGFFQLGNSLDELE